MPVPDLIREVKRFPACAKPLRGSIAWTDAAAGAGRSDRIMRKRNGAT
jgi:hypothetical protein